MAIPEGKKSRFLWELFVITFIVSLLMVWHTTIVAKDYVVFTDPELVPETTDFFAAIPAIVQSLWTR